MPPPSTSKAFDQLRFGSGPFRATGGVRLGHRQAREALVLGVVDGTEDEALGRLGPGEEREVLIGRGHRDLFHPAARSASAARVTSCGGRLAVIESVGQGGVIVVPSRVAATPLPPVATAPSCLRSSAATRAQRTRASAVTRFGASLNNSRPRVPPGLEPEAGRGQAGAIGTDDPRDVELPARQQVGPGGLVADELEDHPIRCVADARPGRLRAPGRRPGDHLVAGVSSSMTGQRSADRGDETCGVLPTTSIGPVRAASKSAAPVRPAPRGEGRPNRHGSSSRTWRTGGSRRSHTSGTDRTRVGWFTGYPGGVADPMVTGIASGARRPAV